MKDIFGYHLSEQLSHWDVLCEEWGLITSRFTRALGGEENIFDFTERPNVGALAAAAWKGGYVCLEEFRQDKPTENRRSYGRCDLWISSSDLEQQEYIEAKHIFMNLEHPDPAAAINASLDQALTEAKRSAGDYEEVRNVGICFVSVKDPGHMEKQFESRVDQLIQRLEESTNAKEYSAVAWSFPELSRQHHETEQVGVLMVAQSVRTS